MTDAQKIKVSKFLSLVLRHQPEAIGLQLDEAGWAPVEELMRRLAHHNRPLTAEELDDLVQTNPKQRFAFSEDHARIRANQGHSVEVDLQLPPQAPPELLYHGTVAQALPAIRAEGLKRMSRQHIHLSKDTDTAIIVGQRRGKPIILTVRSGDMHRAGLLFYQSENGVWLTDAVTADYLDFPTTEEAP